MVAFMADRQKSSSKASGTVKKVTSSASIRALVDSENSDLSSADKRRNKLGYHRTAVACGHCRRRKIRCVPSLDTNATRCQNCIRLKKDCQFYPVDQPVVLQPRRNHSEPKGDALALESETSVSSSSPRVHTGAPTIDQYDQLRARIDTTPIPQGSDREYSQTYDHRHWYQSEHPQHPYWLQHDHNHPGSFSPSSYPITPTTTGQPITSHEHAYTYPAMSLDHPNYSYSTPRPQDGSISVQHGSIPAFGGIRANTVPDEGHRGHEIQQAAINVPSQHIMGPPFQQMHSSPSQYAPSGAHQVWVPATSEPQHHPNYIQPGQSPAWYNHAEAMNNLREQNSSQPYGRDTVLQDPAAYHAKPG